MPTMNMNTELNATDNGLVSYYSKLITDASKAGRIVSTNHDDKINAKGFHDMIAPVLRTDIRIKNEAHEELIAKEVYLRLRRNGTIKSIREKLHLAK